MDKTKKTLIAIALYLWQLPQNILGFIIRQFYRLDTTKEYRGKTIRICKGFPGGISLGNTIIVDKYPNTKGTWDDVRHEYGHTIQSKYLGWFYLFVIGIPSALWSLIHKPSMGSYYVFYTEKWADKLGEVKDRV